MVGSSDFEKGLYHFGGDLSDYGYRREREDSAFGDHASRDPAREIWFEEPPYFSTYKEAKRWSHDNKGATFTRSSDGIGFVPLYRRRLGD